MHRKCDHRRPWAGLSVWRLYVRLVVGLFEKIIGRTLFDGFTDRGAVIARSSVSKARSWSNATYIS